MLWSSLTTLAVLGVSQAARYTNPIQLSLADPFIVYDNDTSAYYLTGTTGNSLELLSAKTLDGLRANPDRRLMYQDAFSLNNSKIWAPEIHKLDGKWYFYYSNDSYPYVLEGGENPFDNYTNPTRLTDRGGIDGAILNLNDKRYFVWSAPVSALWISELESPTQINNDTVGTISHPDQVWEYFQGPPPNGINEAPMPLYWNGETYMMYSASGCGTADYALGILHYTGGDPLLNTSWAKHNDSPVFSSADGIYGPGHNAIFSSPDGTQLWNVYHAVQNPKGACDGTRATFVKQVNTSNFNVEYGPDFGEPAIFGTIFDGPSGEPDQPEAIGDIRPPKCDHCWVIQG